MTTPLWLLVLTPIAAFVGAFVGHFWSRRATKELDRWRRREETMRMVRWAADQAGSAEARRAGIGYVALVGLLGSELLQDEDVNLITRSPRPERRVPSAGAKSTVKE